MPLRFLASAVLTLALATTPSRADMLHVTTLGDSLTDAYANYTGAMNPQTGLPFWGHAGDKNWVEQFQTLRPGQVALVNQARAGAISGDLLGQVPASNVRHAALIVGSNDILAALQGNLAPLGGLPANLHATLNALQAAGGVALVLGNIPNLAATPLFQALLPPAQIAALTGLIQGTNLQIAQIAADRGLPMLDLFGLSGLAGGPLTVGGVILSPLQLFTPDLFHPGTVLHGLLANTFLEAEQRAFGTDVSLLRLSDQEILNQAGIVHSGGTSYFDVSPYVQFTPAATAPEPSSLVLAGTAIVCSTAGWYRRRRKSCDLAA